MSIKKYSDYIALHEQKSKTIGFRAISEQEDEAHDTISYPLSKQSFRTGMKNVSGESGTIHSDANHHAKETEAGESATSDNIVYGIRDKKSGTVHGVSISMSKKTTPEKVAKAAGSDTIHPVHKEIADHHNLNYAG